MANKKEIDRPPKLIIPKNEASIRIESQIRKGRKLYNIDVKNQDDFSKYEYKVSKWHLYNIELLTRFFDSFEVAKEYESYIEHHYYIRRDYAYKHSDLELNKENLKKLYIQCLIVALESFKERIEIIPEKDNIVKKIEMNFKNSKIKKKYSESENKDIFVVHGHDDAAKEAIARFIQKLGLSPIILHEQPEKGRTIIEKFEDYSNVGFAITLLTPDDLGKSKSSQDEARLRARQNVIFELGYFIGKLGRRNVCALYKEGVELPSDLLGILYIPMDKEGGWKLRVANEIKHSGIRIDLNRVI